MKLSFDVPILSLLTAFAFAGCHQPAAAEVDSKRGPAPISIAIAAAHQQSLDRA